MVKIKVKKDEALAIDSVRSGRYVELEPEEDEYAEEEKDE